MCLPRPKPPFHLRPPPILLGCPSVLAFIKKKKKIIRVQLIYNVMLNSGV